MSNAVLYAVLHHAHTAVTQRRAGKRAHTTHLTVRSAHDSSAASDIPVRSSYDPRSRSVGRSVPVRALLKGVDDQRRQKGTANRELLACFRSTSVVIVCCINDPRAEEQREGTGITGCKSETSSQTRGCGLLPWKIQRTRGGCCHRCHLPWSADNRSHGRRQVSTVLTNTRTKWEEGTCGLAAAALHIWPTTRVAVKGARCVRVMAAMAAVTAVAGPYNRASRARRYL